MIVRMAVATGSEFQPLLRLPHPVTLVAVDGQMPTFQRITRFAVIESDGVDDPPSGAGVTGAAIVAQFPFVGVGMAGVALTEGQADELNVIGVVGLRSVGLKAMTLRTRNAQMLVSQNEFGGRVIEADNRFPGSLVVTFGAVLVQLSPVFVAMTTHAGARKAEIRPVRIQLLPGPDRQASKEPRLMAATAIQGGVFPLESIAGKRMIEGAFTVLPVDQLEVTALMFHVAVLAAQVFRSAVQALAGDPLILNARVAGQAFVGDQFMIAAMTVRAVSHAFQKRMDLV